MYYFDTNSFIWKLLSGIEITVMVLKDGMIFMVNNFQQVLLKGTQLINTDSETFFGFAEFTEMAFSSSLTVHATNKS